MTQPTSDPIDLRTADEVQDAHDVFETWLEELAGSEISVQHFMTIAIIRDVLCWMLKHENGKAMEGRLAELKKRRALNLGLARKPIGRDQ